MMMRRRSLPLVLATVLTVTLTACGGGSDPVTVPPQTVRTLSSVSVAAPTVNVAAGESAAISANAFDASNAALSGVTFTYASSNATIAEVSGTGSVLALGAGSATITVTGTLSGVSKSATVAVTVTGSLPASASVLGGASGNAFAPATVVIATGGSVGWTLGPNTHNVTFDAATGAPAGVPNGSAVTVSRAFTTAGDFAYQCTIHAGMTGRVVVR